MHTYIYTYIHACMLACMHASIHPSIHTCIHACMHACMQTYIHTYIHTVYGEMHLKDLLGSFLRVGYRIPVPDFYLVLHGLRCRKSTVID